MKQKIFPFFLVLIPIICALVLSLTPLNWSTSEVTFYYQEWAMPVRYGCTNGSYQDVAVSAESIRQGFVEENFTIDQGYLSYADGGAFTFFGILSDDLTVNAETMKIDEWISPSKAYMSIKFLHEVVVALYQAEAEENQTELFHSKESISPRSIDRLDFLVLRNLLTADGKYFISFVDTVSYTVNTSAKSDLGTMQIDLGKIEMTLQGLNIVQMRHDFNVLSQRFPLELLNPDLIRAKNIGVPALITLILVLQAFSSWHYYRQIKNRKADPE